jgi:hypothetical protein
MKIFTQSTLQFSSSSLTRFVTALSFVFVLLCSGVVNAQTAASYNISRTTTGSLVLDLNGNTVDMTTGTTPLAASGDNTRTAVLTFPSSFAFTFAGTSYTQFSTNSNGYCRLGSTRISTTQYDLALTNAALITPFGEDLYIYNLVSGSNTGKLIGTAPNRCYVIQWANMNINAGSSSADGTFQLRLYEGTNRIEFVYGAMSVASTFGLTPPGARIGFSNGTTDIRTVVTPTTYQTPSSIAAANINNYGVGNITDLNSAADGSRVSYVFSAPATKLTLSGVPGTGSTGSPISTFTVLAQNGSNVTDPNYTGTVTITKASGPGTISGTLTAACVAGVATFSNVGLNLTGTYTITASSGALTTATSGNIVISNSSASNISGNDGVNWVGTPNGFTQPTNCNYGDYRVLTYRKVSTTANNTSDGRGQWATTINVQSSGGNITPSNMTGGGGGGFVFTSGGGCGNTGNFANKWNFSGVGVAATDAVNGAQWVTSGGNDMGLNMSAAGRYTFVLKDNGYNATGFYVGYTTNAPVTMTHNTATQQLISGTSTTISFTLSGAPSTQEKFYVRFRATTNDFSTTNNVVQASLVSGNTYSATITGQTSGNTIFYYIFSSTMTLANITGGAAADISYEALNYADNSGSNYSYVVPSPTTYIWRGGASGVWNLASNWTPSTGFPGSNTGLNDAVVFDTTSGTATITAVPTVTLTSIALTGTANITLQANTGAALRTITLTNAATSLSVASGASLTITGVLGTPTSLGIVFTGAGNTATIAGTLTLASGGTGATSSYNATNSTTTVSGTMGRTSNCTVTSSGANLIISPTGTFQLNGGAAAAPTATWNAGSTLGMRQTVSAATPITNLAQSFSNVTVNANMTSPGTLDFAGALTSIEGNLTVTTTGTGSLILNSSASTATITVGGNYSQAAGTVSISTSTGTTTVNVAGTGSISSGTLNINGANAAASPKLSVAGAFTQSGGTINLQNGYTGAGTSASVLTVGGNFSQTAGTIEFATSTTTSATATYTMNVAGTFSRSGTTTSMLATGGAFYGLVNMNGTTQSINITSTTANSNYIQFNIASGTTTLLSNLRASAVNVLSNATLLTSTFFVQNESIPTVLTCAFSNSGTLGIGSPNGITSGTTLSGNIQGTGTRTYNTTANYIYNGTVAQAGGNGLPTTVNNLTIANTNASGVTLNTATNLTVNGTLTLTSNPLNFGTGASTLTLNGPISTTTAANVSLVGNNSSSALIIDGAGALTNALPLSGSFGNFTWSRLLGGAISGSFNVAGNWTNNATTGSSVDLTTNSTTVSLNGASITQTLTGNTTFNNLTISGGTSSIVDFGSTTTTIANTFSRTAGTTMTPGTSTIIFTGASGSIVGGSPKTFNNLQINNGAVITTAATAGNNITINGSYTNNGSFIQTSTLTTNFGGATQALLGNGTTTFGSVTVQGGSTVNSGSHNIGVTGTFSVSSGGTFNGGTATVAFSGTTTMGTGAGTYNFNNFTISSGTLSNANNKSFNVGGNWTNNGTYTAGTETISFTRTSTQTVGGANATTFNSVTVSGAGGGLSLGNSQTINGTLTFSASSGGSIDLNGSNNITIGASDIVGENCTRLFTNTGSPTQGNGYVQTTRTLDTNPGNVASLGLNIQTATALGSTNIKRFEKAVSSVGAGNSIARVYSITPTTEATGNVTLTSSYCDEELNGNTESTPALVTFYGTGTDETTGYSDIYGTASNDATGNTVTTIATASLIAGQNNITLANAGTDAYYTVQDGDWNTATTWVLNAVPPAGVATIIKNTVTINGTVTNAPSSITINIGKSLTFGASGSITTTTLTNNGSVVMTDGGTLTLNNGATIENGTSTFTGGTGTVVASGTLSLTGTTLNFNNLTLNGALTNSATTANIKSTLRLNQGSSISGTAFTYDSGAASTISYTGTSTQTATNLDFPSSNGPTNVIVNNAGGFRLPFSRTVSGNFTVTSGDVQNLSGSGVTLTMTGTDASLVINGSITGTNVGGGNDINLVYNAAGILSVSGSGSLSRFLNTTIGTSSTLALSRSFEVMFGTFAVNGILRIDNGGSVSSSSVSPVYGVTSTLVYNSGTTYGRFSEWSANGTGTIGTTAGYPNNVTVQGGTTLNLSNYDNTNRALAGNLTLGTGNTSNGSLTMEAMTGKLTVNGNVIIGGNSVSGASVLTFSTNAASPGIEVVGNWTRNQFGSFADNGRATFFIGSGTSTITTNNTAQYTFLFVNKSSGGSVSLANAVNVSNTLSIANGAILNLGAFASTAANLTTNGNVRTTGTSYGGGANSPATIVDATFFSNTSGYLNVGTCGTYGLTSIAAAATVCVGNTATINVTSTAVNLPNGNYTVFYTLGAPNAGTGNASMTVSGGIGSFTTSALANTGATNITINFIRLGCVSVISSGNTASITVNPNIPASVSIAASATTICSGTSVTFTATPTNGGSTPSYQWYVGATPVGTNSANFTSSALTNGNSVSVVMTSNATCISGSPATSNSISITVNPTLTASVSIAASATTICSGTSVTFTATPTNGGASPSYQWKVNGVNVGTNSETFTSSALTNGDTVSVVMTSNASPCLTGSPATSNSISMTVSNNNNWIGTTGLWSNPANWSCGSVPSNTSIITISSGTPTLDVNFTVGNSGSLTLDGDASLIINSTASLTVAGSANFNARLVTFKSDVNGTGAFGPLTGTLSGATNVTTERYFSARRAFRFTSSAVTTDNTTIRENWQEGYTTNNQNPSPGFGTHITGAGGSANGFDTTVSNASSLFTFNNSNAVWEAVANTNATILTAGVPYRINVRGDRSINLANPPTTTTATVLRATGTLKTGPVSTSSLSSTAGAYNFIGNPYQAPVDIKMVIAGLGSTNISNTFYYVWDPTRNTRGAYVSVDLSTANGTPSIGSAGEPGSANKFLQPGQACFVRTATNGAASITFQESHKDLSGSNISLFRNSNQSTSAISNIKLRLYDSNSLALNQKALDGSLIFFDDLYNNGVDQNDGAKFTNPDEMFSTFNNGALISIEKRLQPTTSDIIPIRISQYRGTNYTIVAQGENLNGIPAYLHDQFLQTYTEIPQFGSVNYPYTIVTSNTQTTATDRFRIVFSNPLLSTANNEWKNFTLYPNPSKQGNFNIILGQPLENGKVTIYNTLGVKVYNQDLENTIENSITPNQSMPTGVYYVEIQNGSERSIKKLIIE